jgi:hypothetical protein
VSIIPAGNLITNIGFDSEATHTRRPSRRAGAVPTHAIERPLRHPSSTTPDDRFEHALSKTTFPFGRRLVASLPAPAQDRIRELVYRLAAVVERRVSPKS